MRQHRSAALAGPLLLLAVVAAACVSLEGLNGGASGPSEGEGGVDAAVDGAMNDGSTTAPDAGGPSPSLAVGLLVSLAFDEGMGKTTRDLSGKGNDGTLNGGATWAPGKHGSALSLNGSGGYVRIEPSASLIFGETFSVALWLNLDAVTGDARLVVKDYDWDIKLNARQPQLTVGSAVAAAFRKLPVNEWHHVVFTLSKADCRTYFDGNLGLFETNTIEAGVVIAQDKLGMHVGSSPLPDDFAKGLIDDLRIYDRVLTDTEIAELAR